VQSSTAGLVLPPDAAIDLQVHTTYSDGTWAPERLLDYLIHERFSLAAITDHDRVDTAVAIQQLAVEKQLPVLVAVEMSASWNGAATDVLCYGFDPDQHALGRLAEDVLSRQQANTRAVYDYLCQAGYIPGDPDELLAILARPSAQQPHEFAVLLQRHSSHTPPSRAILRAAKCDFATNDLAAIVAAAHRSGAVCLIAHPGRGDGFVCYDAALLDRLRQEVPIDGLEVYYPAHTPEQVALYLDYAQNHDLLISAGSDSHGPDKQPIKYPAALSRKLLERVGVQIANVPR